MYTYKIKVLKTSGFLKESAGNIPKILTYKSAKNLNEQMVFNKALKYIRKNYGVILEMAGVNSVDAIDIRTKKKIKRIVNKIMAKDSFEIRYDGSDRFIDKCIEIISNDPSFNDIPKDILVDTVTDIAVECLEGEEDAHIRQANSFNDYLSFGEGGIW